MIQQTSIQSYQQTLQEPKTDTIRNTIYRLVNTHQNLSRNDIQRITKLPINTITGRVNELIEMGYITAAGTKKDRLTNRNVQILHPIRNVI
jgi:Mn-dependent DtxR family transcriptional regulator